MLLAAPVQLIMLLRKVHTLSSCVIAFIIYDLSIAPTIARLQPEEDVFPTNVNEARLPNVRQGLNDCHLRYHKYGDYNLTYPIYGVPTRLGEFPHMASLGWTKPNGSIAFKCGGSLITKRHVLTAAHCAKDSTPDVVRLGIIHINATINDPNNAGQDYRIASFKRHPKHNFSCRYYDVAIITLVKSVTINNVVAPACLWNRNDVNFQRLEAIGFGQTSYHGPTTPILLKVQLSPIPNQVCNKSHVIGRNLRQGIIGTQLCAHDEKMDTCIGDSGGPLQIKLLANHRSTPFIVGVTSFGNGCGLVTPSVYTRVSSYLPWIEQETGESFSPEVCATRYVNLREIDDAMIGKRVGDDTFIELEKSYMDIETLPKHQVYLGYMQNRGSRVHWSCGGVLINEDYVLTVAHCGKFLFNKAPSYVKVGDLDIHRDHPEAQIIGVERFIKHPNYRMGYLDYDIALVKLATDVKIGPTALPACLVDNNLTSAFYEMAGLGPYNLNNFLSSNEIGSKDNTLVLTRMRADPVQCEKMKSNFIMCTRNEKFLIPNTCRIEPGGALEREIWHYDRHFTYVFGIAAAGTDCGFGKEAYYQRTSAHIGWIESVVLGKVKRNQVGSRVRRQIVFPDDDYQMHMAKNRLGQSCLTDDNTSGIWQKYAYCPDANNSTMRFYGKQESETILCCETYPYPVEKYRMRNCTDHWKRHKRSEEEEYESIPSEGRSIQEGEYPHVALVGINLYGRYKWSCMAVLVSDRFVLSSGDCVSSRTQNVVRLGAVVSDKGTRDVSIKQIKLHPNYDSKVLKVNVALIELKTNVEFESRILPACLWSDKSSIPLKLYTIGIDNSEISVRPRVAKYNADCRKMFPSANLTDDYQFCAENYYLTNNSCVDRVGDPVEAVANIEIKETRRNITMPYVVGITEHTVGCPGSNDTITIYSRLSEHMHWIQSVVES